MMGGISNDEISPMMGGISDHQEGDMRGEADELLQGFPRSALTTSGFPSNL